MTTLLQTGVRSGGGMHLTNYSVADQTPTAATRVVILGSELLIPPAGLRVGTILRWKFTGTKTAAGTATSTIDICTGATKLAAAQTARVSFTKPAGTAAADAGTFVVEAVVRSVSATGVIVGNFNMTHNLAATGHAQIPSVNVQVAGAGFDNTALDGSYIALAITTGASDALTIEQCSAELINP